MNLKSLLRG